MNYFFQFTSQPNYPLILDESQNPQWPIIDGEPYFFIGQLEFKSIKAFHDNGIIYIFISNASGEIKNVIQTY